MDGAGQQMQRAAIRQSRSGDRKLSLGRSKIAVAAVLMIGQREMRFSRVRLQAPRGLHGRRCAKLARVGAMKSQGMQSDLEPAIVATLPSGAYTAIVSGKQQTTGVALVEIYALQ